MIAVQIIDSEAFDSVLFNIFMEKNGVKIRESDYLSSIFFNLKQGNIYVLIKLLFCFNVQCNRQC